MGSAAVQTCVMAVVWVVCSKPFSSTASVTDSSPVSLSAVSQSRLVSLIIHVVGCQHGGLISNGDGAGVGQIRARGALGRGSGDADKV